MNTTPRTSKLKFEFVITTKELTELKDMGGVSHRFTLPKGTICKVREIEPDMDGPCFKAIVSFGEFQFPLDETEAAAIYPNDNKNPLRVYFISDFTKTPEGEFIPCIAVYGESGYYKTDWAWGSDKDMAQEICNEINERMGVHPEMAAAVVVITMRKELKNKDCPHCKSNGVVLNPCWTDFYKKTNTNEVTKDGTLSEVAAIRKWFIDNGWAGSLEGKDYSKNSGLPFEEIVCPKCDGRGKVS